MEGENVRGYRLGISYSQGPIALAIGAGGGCLDIFTLICPFSPLSPSLWETARYRLKYCLKGPLNPKQSTNSHLYCLVVQAGFYSDMVECSTIDRRVPGSILGRSMEDFLRVRDM